MMTKRDHGDHRTISTRHIVFFVIAAAAPLTAVLGGSPVAVAEATNGSPSVALYAGDVTRAGYVELLPFLREQAVSITAHRFGTPRRYEVPPLVG